MTENQGHPGSPVYLSGPMFSAADLWQQALIAETLEEAGFTTYLPQRDGIEVGNVMHMVNAQNTPQVPSLMLFIRQIVFAMDMYQLLSRCKSLVFNMDGRVPDDGSVSETAAAFAYGQPIVIYKTTPITMLGGMDNPMVSGLTMNWGYVDDVKDLPAAVTAAVEEVQRLKETPAIAGSQCQAVIDLGGEVWARIDAIHEGLKSVNPNDPNSVKKAIEGLVALEQVLSPFISEAFPNAPAFVPPSG
jgi:nucleoside 2-deoxyribosyltransferase